MGERVENARTSPTRNCEIRSNRRKEARLKKQCPVCVASRMASPIVTLQGKDTSPHKKRGIAQNRSELA